MNFIQRIPALLLGLFLTTTIHAQTTTDNSLTVEEVVNQFLLGDGVEAFNVTYNGFQGNQIEPRVGTFDASDSDFAFEEGMVMTTKNIQIATCGTGSDGSGSGQEDDLSQIVNGGLNDVTVIEFDFIPAGDSVKFNFIFASREYHNFVCSGFNDVFGFFISGPGIDGPFSNNGENIALLPDGVTPVAINTVNNGNPPGSPCTIGGTTCPCNSEYFVDNGGNNGNGQDSDICFGGYTTPLVAQAVVQCGEIYHMKLAIANVADGALDSGVFLEKGSFTSNVLVDVIVNPVIDGLVIGDNDFNDGVVAGCSNAQFCMFRPDTAGVDTAYFSLGGSAQAGVQYIVPNDTMIVFPAGVDTVCIDIISIANDLGAQVDSLTITTISINACGDTLYNSASIAVYNEYSYDVATTDITLECPTDFVNLTGEATGGLSPYSYQWSFDGEVISEQQTTQVEPPTDGNTHLYNLIVTDACGLDVEAATLSVTDATQPDPIVSIEATPDTIGCVGETVELVATGQLGAGDLGYLWNTGEETQEIEVAPDGLQTITYYYVTVTDECDIAATDSIPVYFVPADPPVADPGEDVAVECPGDEVEFTANAIGGSPPYVYLWEGIGNEQSISVAPNVTTTYFLTITDNCQGVSETAEVTVTVPEYDPITVDLPSPTSVCVGDQHVISADVSGGAGIYFYEWSTGSSNSFITVSPDQPWPYDVTVTDQCGNIGQGNTIVNMPDNVPISVTPNARPACTGESFTLSVTEISGGAGETASDYFYAWVGPLGQFIDSTEVSSTGSITLNNAEPGIYTLFVMDVCGDTASKSIDANVLGIEFIPNVITPNNGDNVNDVFIVPGSHIYETRVTIMDRWGKVAFESDQYVCDRLVMDDPGTLIDHNCWRGGDNKGDVFYYMIDVDNGTCGFQGVVHILDND